MNAVLAMIFLLVCTKQTTAQTSYKSGFYNTDSLFFTINWVVGTNQQLQWSVNRFTEDSWQSYTTGVWLKNRSANPNTWEDILYGEPDCIYPFQDTVRATLRKLNVVRVRIVDNITGLVTKDSSYTIGVGLNYPHDHYSFYVTADSLDAVDIFKNAKQKPKKRAYLQILNSSGKLEVNQPIEFDPAGGSSLCLPNKGVAFKASNDSFINGPNNMKTAIFGLLQNEKKIKFRVGGNGQQFFFGSNEIVQRILDYTKLRMGGVKNSIGTWYLNGSYWSLGFPQRKLNERYVAQEYDVNKDSVGINVPIPFRVYVDTIYVVDSGTIVVFSDSMLAAALGLNTVQFFRKDVFNFDGAVFVRDPSFGNKLRVVGNMSEGTKTRFEPVAQSVVNLLPDTLIDHFVILDSLLDIDSWLRYLSMVNYLGIADAIDNNVSIGITDKHKPFILAEDFDGLFPGTYGSWEKILTSNAGGFNGGEIKYYGFIHEVISLIKRSPKSAERLMRIYQDMVNTVFVTERLTKAVDEIFNLVYPEKQYSYDSWNGINGGQDSVSFRYNIERVRSHLINRTPESLQQLTDYWQFNDSLTIENDLHHVNLVFDSIEPNTARLILNSDTLTQFTNNWSGYYFKKPAVVIDIIPQNGLNIFAKEYPDSGLHFAINPDSAVTITLIKKQITTNIIQNEKNNMVVFPNPTTGAVTINTTGIVTVINTLGQIILVQEISNKNNIISLNNFPEGMYIIKVIQPDRKEIANKIFKMK